MTGVFIRRASLDTDKYDPEGGPCEDTLRKQPPVGLPERPHRKLGLLTCFSWASSPQNWEIDFFKLLNLWFVYGSPIYKSSNNPARLIEFSYNSGCDLPKVTCSKTHALSTELYCPLTPIGGCFMY